MQFFIFPPGQKPKLTSKANIEGGQLCKLTVEAKRPGGGQAPGGGYLKKSNKDVLDNHTHNGNVIATAHDLINKELGTLLGAVSAHRKENVDTQPWKKNTKNYARSMPFEDDFFFKKKPKTIFFECFNC